MIGDLRVITGEQVASALRGREETIIGTVRASYLELAAGTAVVPHSSFLRFDDESADRIIALPAYVRSPTEVVGIKWISSVPSNHVRGLDRASGLIVINDRATGRAIAVIEGSIISAKRTGASAAVAARALCSDGASIDTVGLIGLGVINYEVLRFLKVIFPSVTRAHAYDRNPSQVSEFAMKCAGEFSELEVRGLSTAAEVLQSCHLTSIATTAAQPHIENLDGVPSDAVVLHISLRDLTVDAILAANNVVDDVDHVCRHQTSVHLAAQRVGHRQFMTNLTTVLASSWTRQTKTVPTVFSPFGLGSLDLAVASIVLAQADDLRVGTAIKSFHPCTWRER